MEILDCTMMGAGSPHEMAVPRVVVEEAAHKALICLLSALPEEARTIVVAEDVLDRMKSELRFLQLRV